MLDNSGEVDCIFCCELFVFLEFILRQTMYSEGILLNFKLRSEVLFFINLLNTEVLIDLN